MRMFKKMIQLIAIIPMFFLLSACGEDGDVAMPAEGASAMMAEIEKAEGVVYQDEIYANWPYNN